MKSLFLTIAIFSAVLAHAGGVLEERYGVSESQISYTPKLNIPVILKMGGHETLVPKQKRTAQPVREIKTYDVAIIGGGPAGLTAAYYLVEAGHSVILLERNEKLGGLAMGNELKGVRASGGAAYSAGPSNEKEEAVFAKLGLKDYETTLAIEEPIDSYLWNGVLYKGIFEEHTLQHLPPSFELFKFALIELVKNGAGHEDSAAGKKADQITMARMVSYEMPKLVKASSDPHARKIMERYEQDPRLKRMLPERRMDDVLNLMNLYGRSALGATADQISARQFIDFYESEIQMRYTGTFGTGTIAQVILAKLADYPQLFDARVTAPVASLENTPKGTRTVFIENGVTKEVYAKKAIFSAPITLAPRLIKDLSRQDIEKVRAIRSIKMTDYAVHVVRVKGHPFRATYDTWSFSGGDLTKPTDYILGRWQDPAINAYKGIRDFEADPVDDFGVISIYQPLGVSNSKNFSKQQNLYLVEGAILDMQEKLGPLVAKDGQKIEVELVESYRWPDSVHIVSPGFAKKTPILARPTGNIHYANNTIASPELESAMARAAEEADKIIQDLKPSSEAPGAIKALPF